ncbi:MAG: deoxyribonuclease [Pirellulaceae bacterium]|nr:deoxyribonuclease [Pirellulaceae bacterium]
MRWLGPILSVSGICCVIVYALTGKFQFKAFDDFLNDAGVTGTPVVLPAPGNRSPETIRIATFNIKTFGEKKSSTRMVPAENIDVMGTLAQVVSTFDLVAIQEVRSQDGTPIRRLIDLINQSGGQYTATLSEPIGDEHYTESYAYVWDDTRIRMIQNSAYVVHDEENRMYREPMVASFETRAVSSDARRPFRFTLINAHTDPDKVSPNAMANEINVLDDVFVRVRQYEYDTAGEEDCLLLGDLNVDSRGLQELSRIPNLVSLVGDQFTNTRRTATYDHILMDSYTTREYTGNRGVLDFQSHLGLTERQALLISDHMPVWAEFSVYEAPRIDPVASSSTRVIR